MEKEEEGGRQEGLAAVFRPYLDLSRPTPSSRARCYFPCSSSSSSFDLHPPPPHPPQCPSRLFLSPASSLPSSSAGLFPLSPLFPSLPSSSSSSPSMPSSPAASPPLFSPSPPFAPSFPSPSSSPPPSSSTTPHAALGRTVRAPPCILEEEEEEEREGERDLSRLLRGSSSRPPLV